MVSNLSRMYSICFILYYFSITLAGLRKEDDKSATLVETYENRLSRDFLPIRYELYLKPDINGDEPPFPYSGKVKIYFNCQVTSGTLTLTSDELEINETSIKFDVASPGSSAPKLKTLRNEASKQFIYLDVDSEFQMDLNYTVTIEFSGRIKEGTSGIYAAGYLAENNQTKYVVATQLEPIWFRKLVPGFDEIDMKAIFDIVVARREEHISLANTRLIRTHKGPDGWIHDAFERSPIMSPYLVCIVVGDLKYLEALVDVGRNLKVRIYSNPSMFKFLSHPNKYYTYPLQKWLEKETQLPYALQKIDHLAVRNFGGAMENWGLITYAEDVLLVSNVTSPASGLLRCANTIAHELSHMWYGNLVTCEWWTHLWLQEGMASYYTTHPLQALGWQGSELHQLKWVMSYMECDQTNQSSPVRIPIIKAQDASMAFARSTYEKGSCLIRMLAQILTQPVLKIALTRYLKTYQYSVANSDQFFRVLSNQAKESGIKYPDGAAIDFKKLMDPWLDQKGFPLVKVVNNRNGTATVTQFRYFNPVNQVEDIESPYKYKWDIPLLVLNEESSESDWFSKSPNYWLKASWESLNINIPKSLESWYIINPNQNFFYRAWYDENQRQALSKQIMNLPTETRAQIIDDTFDLARNGHYGAVYAFENTVYLGSEFSYNPWSVTLKHIHYIQPFFRKEKWHNSYSHYFSSMLQLVLNSINYEFEFHNPISTQFLRKDAMSSACWFGNTKCLNYMRKLFETYIHDTSQNIINANILPLVLCIGVSEGSENDWSLIADEYGRRRRSVISEERYAYAYALTCSPREADIKFLIENITSHNTFVPSKDVVRVSIYLAGTKTGAPLLLNYLDSNWKSVGPRLDKIALLAAIAKPWYTSNQLEKLRHFIGRRENLTSGENNDLTQILLKVEQNKIFYETNVHELGLWFSSQISNQDALQSGFTQDERHEDFGSAMPLSSTILGTSFLESLKDDLFEDKKNSMRI